jgi:enamine deaminase RidA (YjgF/YER057c/UK114 family)
MNAKSKDRIFNEDTARPTTAEQVLKQLGINLPMPPEPFGIYAEAVQTGNLLFLTGMLPTEGGEAKFIGRLGAELDVEACHEAARLAALNGLAVARQHLGSLDKVTRISGSACRWLQRAMSAISRKSPTAHRSCCRKFLEKTKTPAGWCTA